MSYNIDTAAFIGPSTLTIGGADVRDLVKTLGRPSSNFLDAILRMTQSRHDLGQMVHGLNLEDTTEYKIAAPSMWCGEGSGSTYDDLIEKVLPRTSGAADIAFTWEGGDDFSGVRVRNGVVTKHKVVQALGAEIADAVRA